MYVVKVRRRGDGGLVGPMGRMRNWLDARGIEPRSFRLDRAAFHLEFQTAIEAAAFAGAFSGNVSGSPYS